MGHTRDHNPYDLNPLEATHSASGDSSTDDWDSSDDSDDDDDDTEQDTQGLQTEQTQTPTPSYHACGVHETSVSGDHSAAGCGVSGHYVCDGSDHTLQASCSVTNSNGDYCTYASFYACQSHTCVFPAPTVTCARNACGQTVSHRLAHRIDCDNCDNHYWTCIEGATHNHTTTFTCRRSGCGVTFTKCSNGVCPESSAGNYHWAAD